MDSPREHKDEMMSTAPTPPGVTMVKALHTMLTRQSVSDADIHAEEFSGY